MEEVDTSETFACNPVLVLNFYNQCRAQTRAVLLNTAHLALTAMEQQPELGWTVTTKPL